jgi:hypothetical protein
VWFELNWQMAGPKGERHCSTTLDSGELIVRLHHSRVPQRFVHSWLSAQHWVDIDEACNDQVLTSLRQAKLSIDGDEPYSGKCGHPCRSPLQSTDHTSPSLHKMEAGKTTRQLGLAKYAARMSDNRRVRPFRKSAQACSDDPTS